MPVFSGSPLALAVGAALALLVALFAHAVGYDKDKAFYATVLTVVGSLYVLFAVMGGAGWGILPEVAGFAVFAALAALGFRAGQSIVALGLALHGVFDFARYAFLPAPGAPTWWPAFCGAYDIVAAVGLALLLLQRPRKVREYGIAT
jgi:hypothetical protein